MKIIGLTGQKGHGKDTIADYLVKHDAYVKFSFAEPIKQIASDIFGMTDQQLNTDRKEELDEYWGMTPRELLQCIGTDMFRDVLGVRFPHLQKTIWIRILCRKIENLRKVYPNANVVISDVRFMNESDALKAMGAKIIRVQRNHVSSSDSHASELEMKSIVPDVIIMNDGTINDLYNTIKREISIRK